MSYSGHTHAHIVHTPARACLPLDLPLICAAVFVSMAVMMCCVVLCCDRFQTRHAVTITLFAKHLTKEAVSAAVDTSSPHLLSARLQLADDSVFEKRWSLFAPVQPENIQLDITPYRVEIIATKQREEEWLGLLDTDRKKVEGVVKRDNVVRVEAPVSSYPTSSKKKVEWSEVESAAAKMEEEDKPQGDAALQKLFQTIYKDANEDTRRAMIKSFQTSGGTVLSTNWYTTNNHTTI